MPTTSSPVGPSNQAVQPSGGNLPSAQARPHHDGQEESSADGESNTSTDNADMLPQSAPLFVQAQHSFISDVPSALSFQQGDIIEVLTQLESGWWDGLTGDAQRGWFPSNYVRPLTEDDYDDIMASYEEDADEEVVQGRHRNSVLLEKWRSSVAPSLGMEELRSIAEVDEEAYSNVDQDLRHRHMQNGYNDDHQSGARQFTGATERIFGQEDIQMSSPLLNGSAGDYGDEEGAGQMMDSAEGSNGLERKEGSRQPYLGLQDNEEDELEYMQDKGHSHGKGAGGTGQDGRGRPPSENAEDFWLPSLTPDGQICYINAKTGEQSWEVPGLNDSPSAFSTDDLAHFSPGTSASHAALSSNPRSNPSSKPVPRIPTRGSSVEPIDTVTRLNGYGTMLDSGVEMNSTGFASYARRGGDVPAPWVSRMMDDGSGYLYVNQETGESTDDYAKVMGQRSTNGKPPNSATEAMRALGINLNGSRAVSPLLRADSSSSRRSLHRLSSYRPDTPGIDSPRLRTSVHSLARSIPKRLSSATSSSQGNSIGLWEEDTLRGLISELDVSPQASRTISDYQNTVLRRINEIVAASDNYLTACASSSAGSVDFEAEESIAEAAAQMLRLAVRSVIPAVRSLLHACRFAVLGLPDEVYLSFNDDDDAGRRRALSHLSGESVHGYQRRVIAALSKIVFFCHSAVGMDWPFPGSAERVGSDARDLQRAVSAFVGELRKTGCLAEAESETLVIKGLKQNTGHLQLYEQGLIDRTGAYMKKRDWKRFEEQSVERFRAQLAEQIVTESGPDGSAPALVLGHGYEGFTRWMNALEDLDVPMGLDLDGPLVSRTTRELIDNVERYKATVIEAIAAYKSYERHYRELQELSALLMLDMTCAVGISSEQRTLAKLQKALRELDEDLIDLLEVSQDQAQLVAEAGVRGRIGKRSIRIVERERLAKTVRSSSRHSSLTSGTPEPPGTPASDIHKPLPLPPSGPRGHDKGKGKLLLSPSKESLNRSQASLLSREPSGQRTSGSRRSSGSGHSWTQEAELVTSSVRQSLIGRVPFFRTRSASTVGTSNKNGHPSPVHDSKSKMKLQKLLGEEDFHTSPIPQPSRMHAVPSPPLVPTTPTYLKVDYSDEDLIMHPDGTVKAGTLPALVQRLTMHQSLDAAFNSTFLMTYRSFATAQEVFDLLCKRYAIRPLESLDPAQLEDWQEKKMKPVKLRVFNTFKTWVDQHFIEATDIGVLDQIHDFAATVMAHDAVKMPVLPLIKAVQRRQHDGDAVLRKRLIVTGNMPPSPLIPKISHGKPLQLLDINPIELARQMTILESQLYAKIRPIDCLDKAWSEQDAPDRGPNIRAMILNSNRIAAWVGEAILSFNDIKRRSAVFKHWILTADHCRSLHNYSSMMAIMAGLNSGPIYRLSRTKNMLSSKTLALFEEMDRIMQTQKNYATYREILKTLTPPCTPFLGVYLQFLTFIADGNADTIPCPSDPSRQLVHFFKRQKTADIIREIQQYQHAPYTLSAIQPIISFIESSLENAERAPDPWEQSQKMEPREREDEKLARMLRESGMI